MKHFWRCQTRSHLAGRDDKRGGAIYFRVLEGSHTEKGRFLMSLFSPLCRLLSAVCVWLCISRLSCPFQLLSFPWALSGRPNSSSPSHSVQFSSAFSYVQFDLRCPSLRCDSLAKRKTVGTPCLFVCLCLLAGTGVATAITDFNHSYWHSVFDSSSKLQNLFKIIAVSSVLQNMVDKLKL